jgi:hypothetical protein
MPSEPLLTFAVAGLTFSMTATTADAVRDGSLDLDVGYMQGRVKVAGDMAAFYDLLPLGSSAPLRDALLADA